MRIKSFAYRIAFILILVLLSAGGYTLAKRALCEHNFSYYVSDENATYFSDGTKTALCDNGCGKKERVTDNGSMLILSAPETLAAEQTTEAVTLSWGKVEAATGYSVYRKNGDGSEELIGSTEETAFTVEELKPASKLHFFVRAYIKNGKETQCSDASAVIYTSTKCANVENLTSTSGSSAVKLSWEKAEGADGYGVYVKASEGWEAVGECTKETFTVKELSSAETYTFAVRAYVQTDSKVFSDYASHEATTRLKAPETKVELLSKNNIRLTFQAVDKADGYQVYEKINGGKYELYKELDTASDLSISMKADNYYTYAVRGYQKYGDEIVYGEYTSEAVHCSDVGDRVVVNPSEGEWNLVLVNKQRELPQNFVPKLGEIPGGYSIDYRAAEYYNEMYAAAAEEGIYLAPISGYRSNERQKEIFDDTVAEYINGYGMTKVEAEKTTSTEVLFPGTSEHNLGFAVDIGSLEGSFGDSAEYRWLAKNAHKYGFIERYTEEKQEITGIIPEPWHWRFVGTQYAEDIKNSGLCLEEYLEKYNLIP